MLSRFQRNGEEEDYMHMHDEDYQGDEPGVAAPELEDEDEGSGAGNKSELDEV